MVVRRKTSAAETYNRLRGARTGVTIPVSKASVTKKVATANTKRRAGAGRQAIATDVKYGGGHLPASVRRNVESLSGGGLASGLSAKNTYQNIYNKYTQDLNDYNDQILSANATRTEYAASVLDQQVDPNNPSVVPPVRGAGVDPNKPGVVNMGGQLVDTEAQMQLQPSMSETFVGKNINKYALDPIARAISTVPTGVYRGLEAGWDAQHSGAGVGETLSDTVSAAGKGLVEPLRSTKADSRKGWGNIYELQKDVSPDPVSSGLRKLEGRYPWAEQAIADTAGLTGDIFLDPVGKHIGGQKTGVINGERATSESMSRFFEEQAAEKASKFEDFVSGQPTGPGGHRPYASEDAVAQNLQNALDDYKETAQIQIEGGGSKGRYEIHNRSIFSGIAGSKGGKVIQEGLTGDFTSRVQKLIDGAEGRGVKLDGPGIDAYAATNPDFADFVDSYKQQLIANNELPPNASSQEFADILHTGHTKDLRAAEQALIDAKYTPFVNEMTDQITKDFRNSYYNTPGIRIGKKVIPVKALGKAYKTIEDKFMGEKVASNFRYNATFPGSMGLDTTRARALTVVGMDQFEKDLREAASPFTKQEAMEIHKAIELNLPVPTRLQAAKDWVVAQYKWMYDQELEAGARGRQRGGNQEALDPYDPNYVHVSNRGQSVDRRTEFKRNRKAEIHKNLKNNRNQPGQTIIASGPFKTENAAKEGLKPVENAFEALRQRRIKHNRDMTRAFYRNDLVDKYGAATKLDVKTGQGYALRERGLSQMEFGRLSEPLRQQIEHTGEEMFLPREMYDAIREFENITKWNGASGNQFVRKMTKVMNVIKRLQTLPWPGFHNKNMIGDVFMGLLDNINPDDYVGMANKFRQYKMGGKAEWEIVPGQSKSFHDMWMRYQTEANSGFVSAELGGMHAPSKSLIDLPSRVGSRVEKTLQDVSGYREDAGRFTHYVTAYRQEAKALWKKGERDWAKIDRAAGNAALWRVNNYKFDYNALSLWEKQTKTLYFPFYTFMRKAAPTLVQALYQDPRWIAEWTNYMYRNSVHGQEGASGFDGFRIPADIRDAGYAFMPGQEDEKQPWYVTNDILPTSIMDSIDTGSPHKLANSILSQFQVPGQIAIEQATGHQLFQDRSLDPKQSFPEYLLSKVPGTRETDQFFDSSRPWGERLLSSRIGLGLPVRKLRENQQLFAENEWQDRLVDKPISEINKAQDIFYINPEVAQDGNARIYTVKNKNETDQYGNATDAARFYTAQEAIDFIKANLPEDYKKVQKTWDLDNQGNPIHRPVNN